MRKLLYLLLTSMICMMGLVACATPVLYKNTLHRNCQVEKQIAHARTFDNGISPAIRLHSNFYSADVYHSGLNPQWLNRRVSLRANNLPLNLLMNRLLPENVVTAQYGTGANGNQLISLNYTGSIRGALNAISAKTGYAYDIEDGMLTWSNMVTKTFDVSFMPGASQYLMGQKSGDSMLNVSSSGGSNTSSGGNDSQFSSLEANLSVWKDLQSSIKQMLSPDGRVMVSESTTTVSVQDHPENVQKVADFLASMNRDLSREVSLQVKVLEVKLDKNFNYGINWNVAYQSAMNGGTTGGIGTGDLSNLTNSALLGAIKPLGPDVNNIVSPAGSLPGIGAGILSGPFRNTSILINALAQQGSVSTVTNPDVVTLNNQVAQIDISTQTGYLASTTTTVTGVNSTSQTSLNPGTVTTGFKMYILPKIMNHNVYLELSSSISTLDTLQTFTDGTGSGNQIQLPTVSGKRFNLRSVVPSGDTLVIAGFKQDQSTANKATMFGSALLGGKGADRSNIETIVLITPVIVGNNG